MNRGNLGEMLAFMAVVEGGSFVAGARMLGLSRSSTGKAIARLEERLGVRLINRTTRKLSLSDDGRTFLDHCRQVMEAIDEAEASVQTVASTPSGLIHLSVPTVYGRRYVLPALYDYLAKWPKVSVDVNFTDKAVDLVEDGIDLTLRIGIPTTDAQQDTRLISRMMSTHRAVLCASKAYLDKHGWPESLDDLERHECIQFVSNMRRHVWRFREMDGSWVRAHLHGRLGLDDAQAILEAACAGQGVAYLPDFLVEPFIADGMLCAVLTMLETEAVPIVALYTSKKHLAPKTRMLIDHLAFHIGRSPNG